MAAQHLKMGSNISDLSIEQLRQKVSSLRSELEAERKLTKQLRREKTLEIKEALTVEQRKNAVVLHDVKTKLHQDKNKQIENQRSLLSKKHDNELKKLSKQKESELFKLKSELYKVQAELKKKVSSPKCGRSDRARGDFDSERAKLLHDIDELRVVRKQLEDQLSALTEADRQKVDELRKQQDIHKTEINRIKKETDQEVRKLLDELKSKQRSISQLQREVSTQNVHLSQLRADKEQAESKLCLTREAESWEKRSPKKGGAPMIMVVEDTLVFPTVEVAIQTIDDARHKKLDLDIDLTTHKASINRLEEQNSALRQDKIELIQKVREAEMRHKAVLEKNRKFLDKNIELTKENRNIKDTVSNLTQENFQLKSNVESERIEIQRLRDNSGFDRLQRETFLLMQQELIQLRRQITDSDRMIMALKYACNEKDRRIEIMTIRRRNQRKTKVQKKSVRFLLPAKMHFVAGIHEETVVNCSDDASEDGYSSCSALSCGFSTSDVFDDHLMYDTYGRDEFERGYQQLVKEHMELEKSYSMLQSDAGQPDWKIKEEKWELEKDKLERKVKRLQMKVEDYQARNERLETELGDWTEQNEILEFRVLELEENNEKLIEEIETAGVSRSGESSSDTDSENDCLPLEIQIREVKKKLILIRKSQEPSLCEQTKNTLTQTCTLLDDSQQRLLELEDRESSLYDKVQSLQTENYDLLSAVTTGESSQDDSGYEETKQELQMAEKKLELLEKQVDQLKKENCELHEQQDNESFTESERDDTAVIINNLKTKLVHSEKSESELMEKNKDLAKTVSSLKNRLASQNKTWEDHSSDAEQDLSGDPDKLRSQLREVNNTWRSAQEQLQECHTELSLRRADVETCKRQVEERENMIETLEEKLCQTEQERDRGNERIGQLEEIKRSLEKRVKELKHVEDDLREVEDLKYQVDQLDRSKKRLKERINELEVLTEEETSRALNLEEQVQTLEDNNSDLEKKVKVTQEEVESLKSEIVDAVQAKDEEYQHKINTLTKTEHELNNKVKELHWKVKEAHEAELQARDQTVLVSEEKNRRISLLEQQVDCMEANQGELNNAVTTLEDLEEELKKKITDMDSKTETAEKDAEKMKSDMKKLRDRVQELTGREGDLMENNYQLKLENQELQDHIDELISQTEDADSVEEISRSEGQELKVKLDELVAENSDLKEQLLKAKLSTIDTLKDTTGLSDDTKTIAELTKKNIEHEQVEHQLKNFNKEMETKEKNLIEKLQKLEESVKDYQLREEKLNKELSELQESKLNIMKKLETYQNDESEELVQLREKVDVLLDTEERLVDRLTEKEQIESQLRQDLENQESYASEDNSHKIRELEMSEKDLKDELNEWERLCNEYKEKVVTLEESLSKMKVIESSLKEKLHRYELNEKELQSKIARLEGLNTELINSLHDGKVTAPEISAQTLLVKRLMEVRMQDSTRVAPPVEVVLTDITTLQTMEKLELISKVKQLETLEGLSKARADDLEDQLYNLREAVEVLTANLEVNTDVPVLHFRPSTKDSEFEARVEGLVKAEVTNKLQVLQVQKENLLLKAEIEDYKHQLSGLDHKYRAEIDQLTDERERLRKTEINLKAKLEYDSWGKDSLAEAKIKHLEGLVEDLEVSEKKLKHRLEEIQLNEQEVRDELDHMTSRDKNAVPYSVMKNMRDKEEYYQLVEQLTLLESSERDLKDKLFTLEQSDTLDLLSRIAQLERSEKGLKRKVEIMEMSQDSGFNESFADMLTLESPEAILKQRVCDLEKMEQHLKKQILDLEKDREELHHITRKDKSEIHELSVQLREKQQVEKNLKEQLNRTEAVEHTLILKVDDLEDTIEELETRLRQLQQNDRQMKGTLLNAKNTASDAKYMLEGATAEHEAVQSKLQKKLQQIEKENEDMKEKLTSLNEKLDDLEGMESSLKEQIRENEDKDLSQQGRIAELVLSEKTIRDQVNQLEKCNDKLAEKVRELEETASSLNYEMSDLQIQKEENLKQICNLKEQLGELKNQLNDSAITESSLHAQARDLTLKEIEAMGKLKEQKERENVLQDKIKNMEDNETKLKVKVQELEASVSATESQLKADEKMETVHDKLQKDLKIQQKSVTALDQQVKDLKDRIQLYEYSDANKELATIPRQELTELRGQVKLLTETEKNVYKLSKSEKNLKDTVQKLREGKDACGHEMEIQDLKTELDRCNNLVKANEFLKSNHEEVKDQLKELQKNIQDGSVNLKTRISTSKSVQVKLADAVTIRNLAPADADEFKMAVRALGARHPKVYQEFVQSLHPTGGKKLIKDGRYTTEDVKEDVIYPSSTNDSHQGANVARVYSHGDRHAAVEKLVSVLPSGDVAVAASRADAATETEGEKPVIQPRPIDAATETERSELIEGLVSCCLTEDQHWEQIETMSTDSIGTAGDDLFWQSLESGKVDDVTLGFNLGSETMSNSSRGSQYKKARPQSAASSVGSSIAPPLPGSNPPPVGSTPSPDAYYLMQRHDDGTMSADEASEIIDEEMVPQLRARSVDRDSDYSEAISFMSESTPKSHLGKFAASLDSIPDSGLATTKYSELDQMVAPSGSSQEQLVNEVSRLRKQLQDKDNDLKVLQEENKKQQQELTENLLKKEDSDDLDKQLVDKEKTIESEKKTNKDLKDQLNRFKSLISQKEAEIDRLTDEIERLSTGSSDKTNEVDRLSTELRKWQQDCRDAKDDRTVAEETLKETQKEMSEMSEKYRKYEQIQDEHRQLKHEHQELVDKLKSLENAEKDKLSLEKIVAKLKGQLSDMERIELERQDLETRLQATQEALKDKSKCESNVIKENVSLQHDLDDLQKEVIQGRVIEKDFLKVKAKFDQMEEISNKAQNAITPLRAKVIRLSQICKQKDNIIGRLAGELRQVEQSHDLVAEADRETNQGTSEEYTRPLSPLLDIINPKLISEDPGSLSTDLNPSKIPRWHSLLHSTGNILQDDNDLDLPLEHQISTDLKMRPRSKSATDVDHNSNEHSLISPVKPRLLPQTPVTLLNNQRSRSTEGHRRRKNVKSSLADPELYTAVKSYDPSQFSRSGHARLELPLNEGDTVTLLGGADEKGYCQAEVAGQIGLVPIQYLQRVKPADTGIMPSTARKHHHRMGRLHADSSPEEILSMHHQLKNLKTSSPHVPHPPSSSRMPAGLDQHPAYIHNNALSVPTLVYTNTAPGAPGGATMPSSVPTASVRSHTATLRPTHALFEGRPDAPSGFRVERVLGRHSVLLGWEAPLMDELARSNSTTVRGYKLFINNKEKQLVSSPHMTKALVEKLDLHRTHHFSIQTVGDNGAASHMVHAMFDQVMPSRGDSGSESAADGDVSSVLSSTQGEGERRVFMAVYDYNPAEHSPHDFPASELAFRAGDIIVTYGSVRPDGFYQGKAHGKRGLVPASFIEEVALLRPNSKKNTAMSSASSLLPPSPRSSLLSGESCHGNASSSHSHQHSSEKTAPL